MEKKTIIVRRNDAKGLNAFWKEIQEHFKDEWEVVESGLIKDAPRINPLRITLFKGEGEITSNTQLVIKPGLEALKPVEPEAEPEVASDEDDGGEDSSQESEETSEEESEPDVETEEEAPVPETAEEKPAPKKPAAKRGGRKAKGSK
jgi:hypothetical protein